MEDAYAVFPNLCEVSLVPGADAAQDKLPHRIARQMDHADPSSCESTPPCLSDQEPSLGGSSTSSDDSTMESLHFFGVYDGHGGVQAAQHCAKRLHHHLYSALASLWGSQGDACVLGGSCELHSHESENCSSISHISGMSSLTITDSWGQGSLAPTFTELVQPAEHSSAAWPISRSKSAGAPAAGDSSLPTSPSQETAAAVRSRLEAALHSAFLTTDQEFSEECSSAALVGSTAVVALVGRTHLWVANCGEWRPSGCSHMRLLAGWQLLRPAPAARRRGCSSLRCLSSTGCFSWTCSACITSIIAGTGCRAAHVPVPCANHGLASLRPAALAHTNRSLSPTWRHGRSWHCAVCLSD